MALNIVVKQVTGLSLIFSLVTNFLYFIIKRINIIFHSTSLLCVNYSRINNSLHAVAKAASIYWLSTLTIYFEFIFSGTFPIASDFIMIENSPLFKREPYL